jgi:hypothetical protein
MFKNINRLFSDNRKGENIFYNKTYTVGSITVISDHGGIMNLELQISHGQFQEDSISLKCL